MAISTRVEQPSDNEYLGGPESEILTVCRDRREAALKDRRRYEPTWYLCQSFLAGRQWVGWNTRTRRIVDLPNPGDRERHTVNVIGQYHQTVMGKLYVEDMRPDVLFTRDDIESESIADHGQKVAKYIWDIEVDADKKIYSVTHKMLTYGTAFIRCMWDANKGPVLGQLPVSPDGEVVRDPQLAREIVAQAQQMGKQLQFQEVHEGRICWEPLGPFQVLPPPGVEEMADFHYIIVDRTMPVGFAKMRWPDIDFKEQDLRVTDVRELSSDVDASPAGGGQLKDHVLISTMYELPCADYPNGQVINWTEQKLLDQNESLPYTLKGQPHHGIFDFRYHTVDGRFWGKGVIEDLIGPQRQRNRARSQMIEMKDRNLGRVYARKGTLTAANRPTGKIMELIEIPLHADFPQETLGTPVGAWIQNEAEMNDADMEKVAGLREVTLGQAPAGVSAYAAMALLSQQDERRVGPVLKMMRSQVGDAVLVSLDLVRRYWQDGKQLAIVGTSGSVDEFVFRRAQLPIDFYLDVTKTAPLPTDPAAEAQKIFDLYNAAISAGQPLPPEWLKDSLQAGRPLPFPTREDQVQLKKAEMEHYFLRNGQMITPDPFDIDQLHLQVHRAERYTVEMSPDQANQMYVQMLIQHEELHLEAMKQKSMQMGGTSVPAMQGGHGVEGQPGQQGIAQQATGQAPVQGPQGGTK